MGNSGLGGTAGWPVGGAATATGGDAQPHRFRGLVRVSLRSVKEEWYSIFLGPAIGNQMVMYGNYFLIIRATCNNILSNYGIS